MAESKIIIRHILSTISYRLTKSINEVDSDFFSFQSSNGVRKPIELINHMSHVMTYCIGEIAKRRPQKLLNLNEEEEVKRLFKLFKEADELIKKNDVTIQTCLILIQGPMSDILTHVGQISLLRRYFNKPIKGENFMNAKIVIGNIDRESQDLNNEQFE
jgi:hypothetical protein